MVSNIEMVSNNAYGKERIFKLETDLDHISVEHGWDEGGPGGGGERKA